MKKGYVVSLVVVLGLLAVCVGLVIGLDVQNPLLAISSDIQIVKLEDQLVDVVIENKTYKKVVNENGYIVVELEIKMENNNYVESLVVNNVFTKVENKNNIYEIIVNNGVDEVVINEVILNSGVILVLNEVVSLDFLNEDTMDLM